MKASYWMLCYPIACACFMVARAFSFRKFTEDEYWAYNGYNTIIWFAGGLMLFAVTMMKRRKT